MEIRFQDVVCGYKNADILREINLTFKTGEIWCILGSNGIGKTTLFKTLMKFIEPKSGTILFDDKNINAISNYDMAKFISYVPQSKSYSLMYNVLDTVLMGRACHIARFSSPTHNDYMISERSLEKIGISHLAHCMYSELSGGEQQLVLIARALAQESKFIVMDEPASNLDFENQKKILDVMKSLVNDDVGIILSSHSPNHAFYCEANVMLIMKDKTIFTGNADEVITTNNLKKGYGIDVELIIGEDSHGNLKKVCVLE